MGHLIQESSQMVRKNDPSPDVTGMLETLLGDITPSY